MRFSCKSCQATFQTATAAPASQSFRCPSCNGEMAAAAEVVDLWQDRIPTRRYDLDDLRARLDAEREEFARSRGARLGADQIWFAAVQGRQVGPLSAAGIAGLRARGQLSPASLVWREGWPSWVAAEAVPELRPILGLPEETPGRPFPVQPSAPTPPPFDSTYAAARATTESELFVDPLPPGDKTEPAVRIPELLSARAAGNAAPAITEPPAPSPQVHASPSPPAQPRPERPGEIAPDAPATTSANAAADVAALTPVARMGSIVPPLEAGLAASPSASEPEPRATSAPSLVPAPPVEPPALPLAIDSELERAASAVFAQAREGGSADEAHGSRARQAPGADGAREFLPGIPPGPTSAPTGADGPRMGDARLIETAAAASRITPAAPGDAQEDRAAAAQAAPSDPSGASEPLQMIDLSATDPGDEPAPPRRSRPPSQQQWFSSPDARPESDPRSPLVLGAALGLALLVLWLLLRSL